jgi:polysaccharide chain length determinant protein (PEP-CTERM system associated)
MEDVVQRMRRDITVNLEGRSKEAFRVAYISDEPETAQKVTERLASLYIEQNMRDRETLAESTNQFLETQLEDAKRRLIEHEKKLEAYRRQYAGQLPSQLDSNLQTIQNLQMQLQAVNESINRSRERRLLIERQLADAEMLPSGAAAAASGGSGEATPATSAQQLEAARNRLAVMRLRFTSDHPDVRGLERAIRELEAKVAEEASRPSAPVPEKMASPAELARQKRLRDLQAELDVIDRQLATNHAEETRLKTTIAQYQVNVSAVPTRESELVELTRDYSTLQSAYASLLTKREESKIAANLERRQIGEQFRILDPASLPEKPYNQSRRLGFLAAPALIGLLLGLLLTGLLEYLDSSFRREEDVLRALTLPVLALVPVMTSAQEVRSQRRRRLALNVAGTALLLGSAAVLVLWRLQP